MTIAELLTRLAEKNIKLSLVRDELVVRGKTQVLDSSVLAELRENKETLLDLIRTGEYLSPTDKAIDSSSAETLEQVKLTLEEIEGIVRGVPGGAGNVQDIYPLAPLQEGILFHHLVATAGDVYLNSTLESFTTRVQLDAYLAS